MLSLLRTHRNASQPTIRRPLTISRRFKPRLEALEERVVPVIGAFDVPLPIGPGAGFDGIVEIKDINSDGSLGGTSSGTLVQTATTGGNVGLYVLSAAHCFYTPDDVRQTTDVAVLFTLPLSDGNIKTIRIDVTQADVFTPGPNDLGPGDPGYDQTVNFANDFAIIRLSNLAPFGAERYSFYSHGDEFAFGGQVFTKVGYGATGTGVSRDNVAEIQRLRITGNPDGGTFQLSFQPPGGAAEVTADIAYVPGDEEAVRANIESALRSCQAYKATPSRCAWFGRHVMRAAPLPASSRSRLPTRATLPTRTYASSA